MGVFSRKFKQPVRGTATVAGSTACPSRASSARCRMNLVVSIPGVPATPIEFTAMVRADKWPFAGSVLPIEVDLAKPSRMRILWDEVPNGRQRAQDAAQQIAAQMNSSGGPVVFGMPGAPGPGSGAPGFGIPAAATAAAGAAEVAGAAGAPEAIGGFQIPPGAQVISSSVTINGATAAPEQIAAIESLTGMDLDGDGVVGPPA